MRRTITTAIVSGAAMLALLIQPFLLPQDAGAVTAADWQAGNIIDDAIFTNTSAMTVSQIQSWLDTRLQNCDYYGTKPSELSGGIDYDKNGVVTRAEYGRTMGNPAPFTCLNDYYEVPKTAPSSTLPANNYGTSTIPSGAKSAAQLIYDAAQAYNISPKVLLVKLGTESAGPLTSDPWPFERQYLYAMGAHCPDSGPGGSANCDTDYAGFSLQIREAAKLLRWYLDSMSESWWPYKKPYATNYILWNVEPTGCGGSNVYIKNKATAALYTYTPYQPNTAALNNLYGTGDGCSAYGNRNFWRVFNDWFGDTIQKYYVTAAIIDGTTDDSGEQGLVGFKLSAKPTNSVTFSMKVSSPSNARIAGNNTVTITPSTWDNPSQNIIRVSGVANPALVGTFEYSLIPETKITSNDERFHNRSVPIVSLVQLQTSSQGVYRLYSSSQQRHYFTASNIKAAELESQGYVNEGIKYQYCKAGERAIASVAKGDDQRLVVYGSAAYESLLRDGFAKISLDFATSAKAYTPVYWLYDSVLTRSLYTTSESERASATTAGFVDQGIAFYSCGSDQQPVYRAYRTENNAHFYTTKESERNYALNGLGYRYEQVAYYTCSEGTPVYRLFRKSNNTHFYTTSETERAYLLSVGFRDEGQVFDACSEGTPVYRLFRKSNNTHFYTTSETERAYLLSVGFRDEGQRFQSN